MFLRKLVHTKVHDVTSKHTICWNQLTARDPVGRAESVPFGKRRPTSFPNQLTITYEGKIRIGLSLDSVIGTVNRPAAGWLRNLFFPPHFPVGSYFSFAKSPDRCWGPQVLLGFLVSKSKC